MKSELIKLELMNVKSFVFHCACGNGRMVVRKGEDKAVLDSGKYVVMKNGRYKATPHYSQLKLISIMMAMVEKYERFEYEGHLYHSPEDGGIWTKEEL